MRLHRAALPAGALCAALASAAAAPATAVPSVTAAPTAPAIAAVPSCGAASAHDFPITTRVHGGPDTYAAGAVPATWSVDLTNTTGAACRDVHPVIVLSDGDGDGDGGLRPDRTALWLADERGRMRRVPLVTTDEHETIGVLDTDTVGFTVPPGGTVTVRVRLAFLAGTRDGQVTATAATVQREGGDGDWVGESEPYRFSVVGGGAGDQDGAGTGSGTGAPDDSEGTGEGTGAGDGAGDSASRAPAVPLLPQLAATGAEGVAARTALAAGLVLTGAGLVLLVRRHRTRRT